VSLRNLGGGAVERDVGVDQRLDKDVVAACIGVLVIRERGDPARVRDLPAQLSELGDER